MVTRDHRTRPWAFGHRRRAAGARPSAGTAGDALDDAMRESFFATLECELIDRHMFAAAAEAQIAVFVLRAFAAPRGPGPCGPSRASTTRRAATRPSAPCQPPSSKPPTNPIVPGGACPNPRPVRENGSTPVITGPPRHGRRFPNSVVIVVGSTALTMISGTLAAHAFSRFPVPLEDDPMLLIPSTRLMPPVAVAIPIFPMSRRLGPSDAHLGMIPLHTAVNLSLSVRLLKGFTVEIPIAYEEAALIDGYTRFRAFRRVVLPQAATGSTVVLPVATVFTRDNLLAFLARTAAGDWLARTFQEGASARRINRAFGAIPAAVAACMAFG